MLEDIRKACLSHCPAILLDWLPGGEVRGRYYKCASITGGRGKNGSDGSFSVNLRTGQWRDFADATEKGGGDLISLYAAVKGYGREKEGYKRAMRELADKFDIQLQPRKRPTGEWLLVSPAPAESYTTDATGNVVPIHEFDERPTFIWPYFEAEGELLQFVIRIDRPGARKRIHPLTYCRHSETGEFSWRYHGLPTPRPLYNLLMLTTAPAKVLIVEGEKACDAASRLLPDWTCITWCNGTSNVDKADWEPLRALTDARIVLWPDNDDEGQKAMSQVADVLGREVEVVSMDSAWKPKTDLADLEADGWTTEQTEAWIAKTVTMPYVEADKPRPEVDLTGKDYKRQVRELLSAVVETKEDMYRAESGIVLVRRNIYGRPQVLRMAPVDFRSWSVKHIDTYHYNGNGKCSYPINDDLAHACLFHAPDVLPKLRRFAETPVFSAHGELLDTNGYHENGEIWLSIPEGYQRDMPIEEAIQLIDDLLEDFKFEDESDKTNAVAYIVTAIMRDMISGPTPLNRFEAPVPGTGKSLLCRGLTEIFRPDYGDYSMPEDDTEFKKFLTSTLVHQEPVIVFDNCSKLEGQSLALALTSMIWKDRILGQTEDREFVIRNMWAATINNPVLGREILRRSVRIRLNSRMEHPERRDISQFRHPDFVGYVRANRGTLVSAFVSICAAGVGHKPSSEVPRMGSYETWINVVHPILDNAQFTGFLGSIERDMSEAADTREASLVEFVEAWARAHGGERVLVKDLSLVAADNDLDGVRKSKEGKISLGSLGRFLSSKRGVVVSGMTICGPYHTSKGNSFSLDGDAVQQFSEIQENGNFAENESF